MADIQKGVGERTGNAAHDAVDTGNPLKTGGRARTSQIVGVAQDDRVDQVMSPFGGACVAGTTIAGVPRDLVTDGDGRLEISGNIAHDSADAGSPLKVGGRARTSVIAAVAQDDRVDAIYSTQGGALMAGEDAGVPRNVSVNASGQLEVDIVAQQISLFTLGDIAHDSANVGSRPVAIGFEAAEFAVDPPQVSADADRVNAISTPQGIQYVLGGHPNIIRREYMTTGAQTNDPIIDTVPAGSHIVITAISVVAGAAGSTTPKVRIGFGTASTPAEPASGASQTSMVAAHPGIPAGGGIVEGNGSGAIAIGGSDEELRITNAVPTGGQITVIVSYYISTL